MNTVERRKNRICMKLLPNIILLPMHGEDKTIPPLSFKKNKNHSPTYRQN